MTMSSAAAQPRGGSVTLKSPINRLDGIDCHQFSSAANIGSRLFLIFQLSARVAAHPKQRLRTDEEVVAAPARKSATTPGPDTRFAARARLRPQSLGSGTKSADR